MTKASIWIVQDRETEDICLAERLRGMGYETCTFFSGRRAVEDAACGRPDLALIDLEIRGDLSGIETAVQLREAFDVPAIYMTDGDCDLPQPADGCQPYGYLLKPVSVEQAALSIKAAFDLIATEKKAASDLQQTIGQFHQQALFMQTVLNNMNEGLFFATIDGSTTWANPRMEEIVGVGVVKTPPEEWANIYRVYYPDQQTIIPTACLPIMRVLNGETLDDVEVFVRNEKRPEGVSVSVSGRPLWDESGAIQAGLVVFHDITRQKMVETELETTIAKLRTQSQLMQTVLDNMEEGVVVADPAGNFLLTNSRREEIIGQKLAALKTDKWPSTYGTFRLDKTTHFPTEELPIVRAMRGEVTEDIELFIRNEQRPAGAYVKARGRPLYDSTRKVIGGVAIFSDITNYKTTQAKLEQTISELQRQVQLVETVFESISDGVVVADPDGRLSIFNASARRMVGMDMVKSTPDQWSRDFGLFNVDKETHFPTDQIPLLRAIRGEVSDDVEMFIRNRKRPEGVYVSVNGRPLQKNEHGHGGGVVTFRDVSNRKISEFELQRAVEELREQGELMEAVFNSISEGLVVVNTEAEVLNVNPAGRQIAGTEVLEPSQTRMVRKWADYYYPDRKTLIPATELPITRAISHGEPINEMNMFVRTKFRPDGFFVCASVRPLLTPEGGIRGAVAIFRDVTDQVRAEEALVQAFAQGRLEILDTILHNIGNAISSVTIGIDTIQEILSDNQPLRRLHTLADTVRAHQGNWVEYISHDPQGQRFLPYFLLLVESFATQNNAFVETMARVGDRAHHISDIVRTQKSTDKPHMNKKTLDLKRTLSAVVKVLQESLNKRGITVDIHCGDAPRLIRIQESQFHQMMVNLVKNSVEALDQQAGMGYLREPPRIYIRAYVNGDFLHLDVIDNGIGIDSRNLKIVFAAGYSTKKGGTGLGLHSAANFVIGMGGRIEALSDGPGLGTTLRVALLLSSVRAISEWLPLASIWSR